MRRWLAVLSAVVLVPVSTVGAETSAGPEGDPPIGFERPWLRPDFDGAFAQTGESIDGEDVDVRLLELKAQRAGTSLRKPMKAVIAGGILTSVGFGTMLGGITGHRWPVITGGVVVGGGVLLLGSGGLVVVHRLLDRWAIDRQIRRIERSRTSRAQAASWSIGLDLDERKGIRVAWRF